MIYGRHPGRVGRRLDQRPEHVRSRHTPFGGEPVESLDRLVRQPRLSACQPPGPLDPGPSRACDGHFQTTGPGVHSARASDWRGGGAPGSELFDPPPSGSGAARRPAGDRARSPACRARPGRAPCSAGARSVRREQLTAWRLGIACDCPTPLSGARGVRRAGRPGVAVPGSALVTSRSNLRLHSHATSRSSGRGIVSIRRGRGRVRRGRRRV